ncbi:MAG: HAD family hydrolase [Oscillospiraceae bacterium]|nr:HAD family hydrolase [Oscillospiraceae bacterium]
MKTLYVSDLDGTLLRKNETVSEYTCGVIRRLPEAGQLFSYATARSFITASRVTAGIGVSLPVIVYNGSFIADSLTGEHIAENAFGADIRSLLDDLMSRDVRPIVYSMQDRERFSWLPAKASRGMTWFNNSRKGDIRATPVENAEGLRKGRIFYMTCIDEPEKLVPLYEAYRGKYHCILHRDIYSGEQWLEFMPKGVSKSAAIRQLMAHLGCKRLVVFGDGKNDLDMFRMADECYAVENAHPGLKAAATGIIGANEEDGVARWLEENVL